MTSNRITMQVVGLRDLDQALRLMLPTMEQERVILRALHDGARLITEEARRRAPVLKADGLKPVRTSVKRGREGRGTRTPIYGTKWRERGALRSGITQHTDIHNYSTVLVRVRNRGYIFGPGSRNADSAKAGNPNYWWLVEFGTSRTRPQPFLYPAFEAKKEEATRAIQVSLLRGTFAVGRQLGFDVRGWAEAA